MSSTDAPMRSNASRVWSTVPTPSSVRLRALGDDVDDLAGLALDLPDQAGDLRRGGLRALGELAHLLGDDGEAAALLAGAGGLDGGVEREQVGLLGDAGDRVDDAADPLGAGRQLLDRRRDLLRRTRRPGASPPRRSWRPRRPARPRVRASPAASAVCCAVSAETPAARAASAADERADSTTRTCCSAPCATSVTAEAISSIARVASSEVVRHLLRGGRDGAGGDRDLADRVAEAGAHRVVGLDRAPAPWPASR